MKFFRSTLMLLVMVSSLSLVSATSYQHDFTGTDELYEDSFTIGSSVTVEVTSIFEGGYTTMNFLWYGPNDLYEPSRIAEEVEINQDTGTYIDTYPSVDEGGIWKLRVVEYKYDEDGNILESYGNEIGTFSVMVMEDNSESETLVESSSYQYNFTCSDDQKNDFFTIYSDVTVEVTSIFEGGYTTMDFLWYGPNDLDEPSRVAEEVEINQDTGTYIDTYPSVGEDGIWKLKVVEHKYDEDGNILESYEDEIGTFSVMVMEDNSESEALVESVEDELGLEEQKKESLSSSHHHNFMGFDGQKNDLFAMYSDVTDEVTSVFGEGHTTMEFTWYRPGNQGESSQRSLVEVDTDTWTYSDIYEDVDEEGVWKVTVVEYMYDDENNPIPIDSNDKGVGTFKVTAVPEFSLGTVIVVIFGSVMYLFMRRSVLGSNVQR